MAGAANALTMKTKTRPPRGAYDAFARSRMGHGKSPGQPARAFEPSRNMAISSRYGNVGGRPSVQSLSQIIKSVSGDTGFAGYASNRRLWNDIFRRVRDGKPMANR